jgi:iron complex outermembrane recepter protein
MIRQKQIAMIVAATFSTGLASVAVAQQVKEEPKKVDRIEITGSNIKRTDAETIAPVDIITRAEIERSGKQTAAEVIRAIPQNTGSLDEKAVNSFAPGSAGISLRGLGQKATLVLINGRRVAGYGLAQNIQESFVDLNSIPASAIERIEILKDGASAIYGSDAIAGVINVILRKDFRGGELSATALWLDQTKEGKEKRVAATFGYGDLGSQGFNVLGTLDYYKRGELRFDDVAFLKSYDRRRFQGGDNNTSLTVGQFQSTTAVGGLLPTQAISFCPGKVITRDQASAAGFANLNTTFTAGSTFCNYDLASETSVSPSADRLGLMARGTLQISNNLTSFAEVGFSRNKSEQVFQWAFVRTTGFAVTGQSIIPFTYRVFLNPGQGGNPTAGRVEYRGQFWDLGPRLAEVDSDAKRVMVGADGSHFGWEWQSAIGASETKTTNGFRNLISQSGLNAALAANTYNFADPSQNSDAVRNQIRVNGANVGLSKLTTFDLKGSREVFSLAGGQAAIAAGVEFRRESMKITPDARIVANDVLGRGQTSVDGSRNSTALFGELSLPFAKAIEGSLALRTDRYSDYGSSTVPKAGVKWKASDNVLLRANVGKGFRAPTLPEISKSAATFFQNVRDTPTCLANNTTPCPLQQISGVFAANPNLKPEKSTSYNLGSVFDLSKDTSVTFDVYHVVYKDLISSNDFQAIVDGVAPGVIVRDPTNNNLVAVLSTYENQDFVKTSGFDIDAKHVVRSDLGKFELRSSLSYLLRYDQVLSKGQPPFDFVGNNGPSAGFTVVPRYKLNGSLTWTLDPWTATASVRHVAGYKQTAGAAGRQTQATGGRLPNAIQPQTYLDLYAAYQLTPGFTISGSIRNLTNVQPPFDPIRQSTFTYAYEEYDARGRIFQIGAKYAF